MKKNDEHKNCRYIVIHYRYLHRKICILFQRCGSGSTRILVFLPGSGSGLKNFDLMITWIPPAACCPYKLLPNLLTWQGTNQCSAVRVVSQKKLILRHKKFSSFFLVVSWINFKWPETEINTKSITMAIFLCKGKRATYVFLC